MALTLDTIRSLKADKSYYISNATGEIKQAGFWHKFKMYFSVGDAETIALGPGSMMKMTYAPGISVASMESLERALAALDDFDLSAAERAASAPGRVPGRGANVQALLPQGIKLSPGFQTGSVEFVLN